jgi:hypothetical protein
MGAYLIFSDWTDGTAVTIGTAAAPQVVKTWTLDQTDAYNIRTEVVFKIDTVATAVAQTVNPTITIGSNTRTFAFTTSNITRTDYLTAVFAAESRNGDTVTAQVNAAAGNDASTTINVKSFEIIEYCP